MKVIVTGSSGLIGKALVSRLTSEGHDVIRLVRPSSRAAGTMDTSVVDQAAGAVTTKRGRTTDIKWDPGAGSIDFEELAAQGTIDGAVHLAGAGLFDTKWTQQGRAELYASRVESAALLCSALAKLERSPSVLVSGSAIGLYGDRGAQILSESSSHGQGFLADLCRGWEAAASPATEAGIRTVLLRTGMVLTAKGGALAKQLPVFRLGLGGKLGKGDQYVSWISLYDEVDAILFCLSNDKISGPVNATAPNPVTGAQFAAELAAVLRRPAILPVPAFGLRLAFGKDRSEEVLLASQRVLPAKLQEAGFVFTFPELRVAMAHLLDSGHL